jgi:phosphopentomutase
MARAILTGEHAVGRVIARPFNGESGEYKRTANRHDFSIEPPRNTMLDAIKESGRDVIAVGKITDIFAGRGITETIYTHGNDEGMTVTRELLDRDFSGLCFTNLVDFDMLWGHRQDVDAYADGLSRFDAWLGEEFIPNMKSGDVLLITADHGCDPGDASTDHTREYVPLIVYGDGIKPVNLGTRMGFNEIGTTVCDMLGIEYTGDGAMSLKGKLL